MYQAKKEGRSTTRFYQEKMDEWIKKRLFLENGLRNAIKNGELELYYQPVINIMTQNIWQLNYHFLKLKFIFRH